MPLAQPINAVTVLACITFPISVGVSTYFVWNSRNEFAEFIRSKGNTNWLSRLHICLVLLCFCSAVVNHYGLVGQFCVIQDPFRTTCSSYERTNFFRMNLANTVINSLLALCMNWTVSLRWKQMRKNVRFNEILRLCISVVLTLISVLKIAAQVQVNSAAKTGVSSPLVAGSSAALAISSIVFDTSICLMISMAVFESQIRVNRTPEQEKSLRRTFRNFRLSLALLIIVDIMNLGTTMGLVQFPLYSQAAICVSVSSFVVHCLVSNNLLKNFVKQIRNRNDGSNVNDTSKNTSKKTGPDQSSRNIHTSATASNA